MYLSIIAISIDFLGSAISLHGLYPDSTKVTDLSPQPMPTIVSQLCSLLGGISYDRHFLPDLANIFCLVQRLLKRDTPSTSTLTWSWPSRPLSRTSVIPPNVVFPDWNAAHDGSQNFGLYCDTGREGYGAILQHEQTNGSICPTTLSLVAPLVLMGRTDPFLNLKKVRLFGPSNAPVSTSSKLHL